MRRFLIFWPRIFQREENHSWVHTQINFQFAGSHCLDILCAKDTDPEWLVMQRKVEVRIIKRWITKYYAVLLAYKKWTEVATKMKEAINVVQIKTFICVHASMHCNKTLCNLLHNFFFLNKKPLCSTLKLLIGNLTFKSPYDK